MSLSDVVNVTLSRETQSVSQTGFGIVNICGKNLNSASRLEYFSTDSLSAIALAVAGGTTSPEYLAAQSIASQTPKPALIAISQIIAPKILTDNAGTYTAGSFKFTVNNGTEQTVAYTTDKDTTLTAVAAAMQALTGIATAVYSSGSHTITLTPDSGTVLKIVVNLTGITGTMTMTLSSGTASETYADGLAAIKLSDNDWYGLVIISRESADVTAVAAWTEANNKLFSSASSDANIINTTAAADTTTLAATLKAAGYARTTLLYHQSAATAYPDAGYLGEKLARIPGSYTAMFKKITGAAVTSLTPTQRINALGKNCSIYETIGGVPMTSEGKVCEGEFLDVIHFCDWFIARLQEGVFGLLARSAKIPYTPEGIIAVQSEMDKVGLAGIESGGFSKELYDADTGAQIGGFYSTMPTFENISTNDKAARRLTGVLLRGFLAGAIHVIDINVAVTY